MTRYGYMDIERWLREGHIGKKRVFLEGVDITDVCTAFDDTTGEVWVVRNKTPNVDDQGNLITEVITGRIEVK